MTATDTDKIINILKEFQKKQDLTRSEAWALDQAVRILKDPFSFSLERVIRECVDDYTAENGTDINDMYMDILSEVHIDEESTLYDPIEKIVQEKADAFVEAQEEARLDNYYLEREYQEMRL